MGHVRTAAVLLVVLALAGCADAPAAVGRPSDSASPPPPALPDEPGALVLRVEHVGGFVTPETTLSRLPMYSLYADGRLITDGPVPAIYPGPALPNVQVQLLDAATVQDVVGRALAAGVAETADLGTPPVADVPSTRFTLVTATESHVREVYALDMAMPRDEPGDGLTAEQREGRQRLSGLIGALFDLGQQPGPDGRPPVEGYAATAVAALARPWSAPDDDVSAGLAPSPVPWPGPALPGDPAGPLPDLGCVTATGEQAVAVLEAARGANSLTPWSTPDGALWSVTFRPLLPDESGCADLLG